MSNQYIPNDTAEIRRKLKEEVGIKHVDALFSDINEEIRLKKALDIPGPLSELEVRREIEGILKKNRTIKDLASFLGAGVWPIGVKEHLQDFLPVSLVEYDGESTT